MYEDTMDPTPASAGRRLRTETIAAIVLSLGLASLAHRVAAETEGKLEAYPGTPAEISPPVVQTPRYFEVPASEKGPAIDPAKGYRIQDLGSRAYMVTEGVYQMLIVAHDHGLLLVDAPPSIGANIKKAANEIVAGLPITHLVYSHAHLDHIGYAGELKKAHPKLQIVAHDETKKLLVRASDPQRPLPDPVFTRTGVPFKLEVGRQKLQLRYFGPQHQPGNIEIYHPAAKTLMLIDVVFPGWMMWRRLALATDVPGYFATVASLNQRYDYDVLVAGHVNRVGSKADVANQLEFLQDLQAAAAEGLAQTKPGETVHRDDLGNPWAVFDNYIDRVVVHCVKKLTPKWSKRLAGFDVYIYDQCLTMEQSLRLDGPSLKPDGD